MWVVVNAAMSLDGKLASRRREQLVISGPEDFERVAALRRSCDGILVGRGTVVADDPQLTDPDDNNPESGGLTRIVADSCARTPVDAQVLDGTAETIILVSEAAPQDRISDLETTATVLTVGKETVDIDRAFHALEERGVSKLLVEGGGELLYSVIATGLVDSIMVFIAPFVIGGRDAPTLVDGDGFIEEFPEFTLVDSERLDAGICLEYQAK